MSLGLFSSGAELLLLFSRLNTHTAGSGRPSLGAVPPAVSNVVFLLYCCTAAAGGGTSDDLLLVDNATNLLDDVDGAPASHLAGNRHARQHNCTAICMRIHGIHASEGLVVCFCLGMRRASHAQIKMQRCNSKEHGSTTALALIISFVVPAVAAGNTGASDSDLLDLVVPAPGPSGGTGIIVPAVPQAGAPAGGSSSLLGLDVLSMGLTGSSAPATAAPAQAQPQSGFGDLGDLGLLLGGAPAALPSGYKAPVGSGVGGNGSASHSGVDLLAGFGAPRTTGQGAATAAASKPAAAAAPGPGAGGSLLDFGLGDFGMGAPAAAPAPKPAVPELTLNPSVSARVLSGAAPWLAAPAGRQHPTLVLARLCCCALTRRRASPRPRSRKSGRHCLWHKPPPRRSRQPHWLHSPPMVRCGALTARAVCAIGWATSHDVTCVVSQCQVFLLPLCCGCMGDGCLGQFGLRAS